MTITREKIMDMMMKDPLEDMAEHMRKMKRDIVMKK